MKFWEFCHEHPVLIFFIAFLLLGNLSDVIIRIWGH